MRGKGLTHLLEYGHDRITPACAGKSYFFVLYHIVRLDHPRVCGEKEVLLKPDTLIQGSPPRVRGKVFTMPSDSVPWGITPACAGKRNMVVAS